MRRVFGGVGVAAVCVATSFAQVPANHLLLSEVGIDPVFENKEPVSQYVEIFNPTSGAISLDNYFLADTNLYTSVTLTSLVNTGTSDNIIRFPAGQTLAPGQLAVVTHNAESFLSQSFAGDLSNFSGLYGSPLLFEVINTRNDVAEMVTYNSAQSNNTERFNFDLSKAQEFVVLFHWDGSSDLVQDVDIVSWTLAAGAPGDTFAPKGAHVKGANGSQYLPDTGNHQRISVPGHTLIKTRTSVSETSEVTAGGNGISGHDESTENVASTWVDYETDRKSPGLTKLVGANGNSLPQFTSPLRTPVNPSSTSAVALSVNVSDFGGSIASVTAFVNNGSGFIAKPMSQSGNTFSVSLNPMPDDTIVKYYYEAVDNAGGTARLPQYAPQHFETFVVDDSPLAIGEWVVNEIMHSHVGPDAYEFVELYNTRTTPVSLAYFQIWDNDLESFELPEPAVIPGNGYLVLTQDPVALKQVFNIPEEVPVLDWGRFSLGLPDRIRMVSPNSIEFGLVGQLYVDMVISSQSPWPTADWNSGHLSFDLSQPANGVAVKRATPGKENAAPAAAREWTLYE